MSKIEKIRVRRSTGVSVDVEVDVDLLVNYLKSQKEDLIKEGWTNLELEKVMNPYDDYFTIYLFGYRDETDAEFNERKNRIASRPAEIASRLARARSEVAALEEELKKVKS